MGEQGTGESFSGKLVLDAGALIALERGDRRVRALIKRKGISGQVMVPTSALAQVWRGGPRSAELALLIKLGHVDALDENRAKDIGVRLAARGASDVTDGHVVCCAIESRATVATSDPTDINALTGPAEHLSLIAV